MAKIELVGRLCECVDWNDRYEIYLDFEELRYEIMDSSLTCFVEYPEKGLWSDQHLLIEKDYGMVKVTIEQLGD